jgi:hypothetical protein
MSACPPHCSTGMPLKPRNNSKTCFLRCCCWEESYLTRGLPGLVAHDTGWSLWTSTVSILGVTVLHMSAMSVAAFLTRTFAMWWAKPAMRWRWESFYWASHCEGESDLPGACANEHIWALGSHIEGPGRSLGTTWWTTDSRVFHFRISSH